MPAKDGFPSTDEALEHCVASIKGQYDELIIVVNDGIGFGPAVNRGFRIATGDFLFVIGNDTLLTQGSLFDLCNPRGPVAPYINGPDPTMAPRAFYSMPRWVYEKVGGYDEQYEVGFWEDDDLIMRWAVAGIDWRVNQSVIVHHWQDGGLTMKQLDERGSFDRNRAKFNAKWGANR